MLLTADDLANTNSSGTLTRSLWRLGTFLRVLDRKKPRPEGRGEGKTGQDAKGELERTGPPLQAGNPLY